VSSDVAIALGSAFVASILTTIGARWIAGYQAKRTREEEQRRREHEREQARLAHARELRDSKRERLRRDYEDVAFAADTIAGVAKELGLLLRDETVDDRNARLNRRLEAATGDLARPILRLRLEEGTGPMIERYQALRSTWFRYADYELPRVEREQRGYGEIAETLREIEAAIAAILDKAKADLDELSKPL
jgi:DNA-directed RNA polymerase beta subunit